MKERLIIVFLLAALANTAHAHFVFAVPEASGTKVKLIMSEDLAPSREVDIALIGGAKMSVRNARGREEILSFVKGESAYLASLPGSGTRLIHGTVDLGAMQRGQAPPHVLIYYPKTIVGDPFDVKTVVGSETPVEIVPVGKPGALRLKLLVHGKPEANKEITVIQPDGSQVKLKTGDDGQTETLKQNGWYGAWARYWEKAGGERNGKKFTETRHYATLVFEGAGRSATRFAALPQAASSFGAVASGGWLYVYGGHVAPTHTYSTAAVSGRFDRLKMTDGATWERLPGGPGLQGMNLAAYGGKIYRIGGMSPRNKPGDPQDTRSVAECARFDPATMKWEALPPLPEPRSSHDVVVAGAKLIVVGGWTMKGAAGQEWRDTLVILDLAADRLQWKSLAQPFKRRALIAAVHSDRVYVLGGFDERARVIRETAIYDPRTDSWSTGPNLPGGGVNAFAPAACVHEGNLYVSVADGSVYRLNESAREWDKTGSATARVAHRMASRGRAVLIVGGAANGKNFDLIEAMTVARSDSRR